MATTTSNGRDRYSTVAIILHWLIAALIITNLVLAKLAEGASGSARSSLMGPHMAIGISVLFFGIIMVLWRITHPRPPLPAELAGWERVLSKIVHVLFYILIIAAPLAGWLLVSSHGGSKGIDFFGLFTVPDLPVSADKQGHELIDTVHKNLGGAFIYLIALHVLGALKHQFIDKMPYFHRMWPG